MKDGRLEGSKGMNRRLCTKKGEKNVCSRQVFGGLTIG